MVRAKEAAGELPEQTTTEVLTKGSDEYILEFDHILNLVTGFPEEKTTEIVAKADTASIDRTKEYIEVALPDGRIQKIEVAVDPVEITDAQKELEKVPSQKEIELKLQGDIDIELAKIEAQAETIQTAMEWEAKVDIAEIEAFAETVTALSGDIASMFENTGSVIVELFGLLEGASASTSLEILRYLEAESRRRDELLELEKELAETQIEYLEKRNELMESGGGIVTIQGDNLEPELQLVLARIIELTQIEANEQGLEFLIGI
jgi:hypothetical protein